MRTNRRKRNFHGRRNTRGQDHFSKLPEPLIIHILSMLAMKDAIKTSLLAKSWKNLWTQIFNIVLNCDANANARLHPYLFVNDDDDYDDDNDDDISVEDKMKMHYERRLDSERIKDIQLISSINRSLNRCTSTADINKFCLVANDTITDFIKDKWFRYALNRNVKIMELILPTAPDCLFQSKSIIKMELYGLELSSSTPVYMSALQSLLVKYPTSSDAPLEGLVTVCQGLENLVTGCPVLENLVIDHVRDLYRLNVMSPRMKKVKLCWLINYDEETSPLNINAPWIEELELSQVISLCHIVNVSSLVKATLTILPSLLEKDIFKTMEENSLSSYNKLIDYSYKWILMVTQLLNSLSFVSELTVGSPPIQALLLSRLMGTPPPLFMCKRITIDTCMWKYDLPGIACLLENAPHFETLLIKVGPFDFNPKGQFPLYQTQALFHDTNPHLNMPNGKFLHLKSVKIEYCKGPYHINVHDNNGGFFDYELVEYILKSAVVLEKLVLCSSREWRCSDSMCHAPNCNFQHVPSMCSELISTFPSVTGNEAAGWEFKNCNNKLEFNFSNYASLLS